MPRAGDAKTKSRLENRKGGRDGPTNPQRRFDDGTPVSTHDGFLIKISFDDAAGAQGKHMTRCTGCRRTTGYHPGCLMTRLLAKFCNTYIWYRIYNITHIWELSKRSLTGAFIAKVLGYAIISLGYFFWNGDIYFFFWLKFWRKFMSTCLNLHCKYIVYIYMYLLFIMYMFHFVKTIGYFFREILARV